MTTSTSSTSSGGTSTPASGSPGAPTPGQGTPAPGGEAAQPGGTPATQGTATPATPKGPDAKSLTAAVKRTVAIKQREQELAKQAEALKPLQEVQELVRKSPAAALRKMLAAPDGSVTPEMVATLRQLSQEMVNGEADAKSEQAALEALPRSVREKLARLEELEKKAPVVDELQKRLDTLEAERNQARQSFDSRQKADLGTRAYTAGFDAVKAQAAGEVELVLAHPKGNELVQAKWTALLKEKSPELGKLDMAGRSSLAAGLVLDAAKQVQAELEEQAGWALQTEWARGKMGGTTKGGPKGRPSTAPPKSSASSTPGHKSTPRTGTPGSLGEPSGLDPRKLTHKQRMALLREEEAAGKLYSR